MADLDDLHMQCRIGSGKVKAKSLQKFITVIIQQFQQQSNRSSMTMTLKGNKSYETQAGANILDSIKPA